MAIRNPFTAAFLTLAEAAALAVLLRAPVLAFGPLGLPPEVPTFYVVAAFALAGWLAGRSGRFPLAAFPAAFLGGFVGYAAFALLVGAPADLVHAAIHAAVAGAGAWASATWRMATFTPESALENAETRRCRMCGARVGLKARRCWSCRSSLSRIA